MNLGKPAKPMNIDPSVSKVRVIVRVRPFLSREIPAANGEEKSCVSVLDRDLGSREEIAVYLKDPHSSRNECYQLDAFFGQEDDNVKRIFEKEVNPLIPGIFQGCNASVFAYGATGSGKTYTMQGSDELPGLMPLTMSTVLSMCKTTGSTVEISFYEVYMDRCWDLLEVKAKEIAIWDDKDGQIHLRGLSRIPVNSMSEFHESFSCGVQRRKVAHTGLNDVSSRSHGVLVIAVSSPSGVLTGKINLIDLAGNEDNRRTCNEGIRLQESAKINQSLFALSNVIYALNNKKPHVPYRESKLTRILQDSLVGTSRALMVACLNPGAYEDSVHTVSLAARSRHSSNHVSLTPTVETPKVKMDMEAKLRVWLESKGRTKSAQRMRALRSPSVSRTPSCLSSVKKSHCQSTAKAEATTHHYPTIINQRSTCASTRNLFNDEILAASELQMPLQNPQLALENKLEKSDTSTSKVELESTMSLSDKPLENIEENRGIKSSPKCEKKCTAESSLRKALSPIILNGNAAILEPKTPKTPFFAANAMELQTAGTPADKFNVWSSSLKSSFIQEYVHFLNNASREELQEIKGIGDKMAEYILELRETSPLTSLNDLEKIGLSSKQVHNLLTKAAGGILGRPDHATPVVPEKLSSSPVRLNKLS